VRAEYTDMSVQREVVSVQRRRGVSAAVSVFAVTLAYAEAACALTAEVPEALSVGAGVIALLAAAALLREMLALRTLACGAAIANNLSYVVLAVLCLAASVLVGWLARFVPAGISAEHARLGAELLSVMAIVLFIVYFARVRRVMSRYLKRLTGEEQLLATVTEPGEGE